MFFLFALSFFCSIFARKIRKTRKILPYFCDYERTKIYNYTTNIIKV